MKKNSDEEFQQLEAQESQELIGANYPTITRSVMEDAAADAIYWWNRDEDFYHKYFSELDSIVKEAELLNFFARVPFAQFLRMYSVRRTIPKGQDAGERLLYLLHDLDFFKRVTQGELQAIDEVSDQLIVKGFTKRSTRSLLSKVAFLINPSVFSLYDGLAKESLFEALRKLKGYSKASLNEYTSFRKGVDVLWNHMKRQELFEGSDKVLESFSGTAAHIFFTDHREAFELRVVDKYLWLRQQQQMEKIHSRTYIEFQNL